MRAGKGAKNSGRWTVAWDPEGVGVPGRTWLKGTLSPHLCYGDSSLQMLEVATETGVWGSELGNLGSASTWDGTVTPSKVLGSWASCLNEMETILRRVPCSGVGQFSGLVCRKARGL